MIAGAGRWAVAMRCRRGQDVQGGTGTIFGVRRRLEELVVAKWAGLPGGVGALEQHRQRLLVNA